MLRTLRIAEGKALVLKHDTILNMLQIVEHGGVDKEPVLDSVIAAVVERVLLGVLPKIAQNRKRVPDHDDEECALGREIVLKQPCHKRVARRLVDEHGPRQIPVPPPLQGLYT